MQCLYRSPQLSKEAQAPAAHCALLLPLSASCPSIKLDLAPTWLQEKPLILRSVTYTTSHLGNKHSISKPAQQSGDAAVAAGEVLSIGTLLTFVLWHEKLL